MNRTVRLVTLLRWTLVAAHTALVLSTTALLVSLGDSRRETAPTHMALGLVMVFDLPATALSILPAALLTMALGAGRPNREAGTLLFCGYFSLAGGLQWYLIASLLGRLTCGLKRAMPVASKRFGAVAAIGLLLAIAAAILPWREQLQKACGYWSQGEYPAPPVAFSGDSGKLERSAVVPTLDTPLPERKNVIWCATFQIAWNHLRDDVIGAPIRVAGAAEVAQRLNAAAGTEDDLPAGCYYAAAGLVKGGIAEKIRREMQARFHKEPAGLDEENAAALAYAYLRANVPFTMPYFDNDEEFKFVTERGLETRVSSFGLRDKDQAKYFDLRDQVEVLYLHREEGGQPTAYARDLCRDSRPNQIILASIPRHGTLDAMLKDLKQKMAENPLAQHDRRLGPHSILLVPNLNWSVQHRFAELEGTDKKLLNARFTELYIGAALQNTDFRLDRSGVALESESALAARSAKPRYPDPCFIFDHPFLIIVKKRAAERPFFVMWVDNAELLCKP